MAIAPQRPVEPEHVAGAVLPFPGARASFLPRQGDPALLKPEPVANDIAAPAVGVLGLLVQAVLGDGALRGVESFGVGAEVGVGKR